MADRHRLTPYRNRSYKMEPRRYGVFLRCLPQVRYEVTGDPLDSRTGENVASLFSYQFPFTFKLTGPSPNDRSTGSLPRGSQHSAEIIVSKRLGMCCVKDKREGFFSGQAIGLDGEVRSTFIGELNDSG